MYRFTGQMFYCHYLISPLMYGTCFLHITPHTEPVQWALVSHVRARGTRAACSGLPLPLATPDITRMPSAFCHKATPNYSARDHGNNQYQRAHGVVGSVCWTVIGAPCSQPVYSGHEDGCRQHGLLCVNQKGTPARYEGRKEEKEKREPHFLCASANTILSLRRCLQNIAAHTSGGHAHTLQCHCLPTLFPVREEEEEGRGGRSHEGRRRRKMEEGPVEEEEEEGRKLQTSLKSNL